MRRLASALPLCVAAAALGAVDGRWVTAAALALAAAALAAVGPRLRAGLIGEVLLGALSLGGGALLAGLLDGGAGGAGPDRALHPFWSSAASATLLAAATRQLLRAPLGGPMVGWSLGMLGLLCCGATRGGARYAVPVYGYLLASLLQWRLSDEHRPPLRTLAPRSRLLVLLLPLAGAVVALAAVAPLRPLQRWVQERFDLAYGDEALRAGFDDRFQLGSLDRLLASDEVVLRLRGPRVDHLRGLIYDRYDGGRWTAAAGERPARIAVGKGRPPAGAVEIRAEWDGDRLFLPLELGALYTESGAAVAVGHGALRRVPADAGRPLWLVPGPRRLLPLAPPGAEDLRLPRAIEGQLRAIAADWTAGEATDAGKLGRIEARLRGGYRYSLHFRRAPALDPVIDFLTRRREGHCEYFASAMALLGRAAGVPARVAGGYRVAERNPLSGDYLVRQRHAHAWVEAYLPGRGWITVDPTPPSGRPEAEEHDMGTARALVDLVSSRLAGALGWLGARPATEVAPAALGIAGALSLYLLARRRRAPGAARATLLGSPPTPGYLRLEAALAARGHARPPWEPLERFAARLAEPRAAPREAAGAPEEAAAEPQLPQAAALILRYAALRYGGEGDDAALEAELASLAAALEPRRRAG